MHADCALHAIIAVYTEDVVHAVNAVHAVHVMPAVHAVPVEYGDSDFVLALSLHLDLVGQQQGVDGSALGQLVPCRAAGGL